MRGTSIRGRLRLETLDDRAVPAVFTVTTTADGGPGSLRQAILDTNAAAGADTIAFNIPGTGIHTIQPQQSELPKATGPVVIDGYTQPGSHPNTALASEMSGRRRLGSSTGSGRYSISDEEPVIASTLVASSSMVNSFGLPMFTGPL